MAYIHNRDLFKEPPIFSFKNEPQKTSSFTDVSLENLIMTIFLKNLSSSPLAATGNYTLNVDTFITNLMTAFKANPLLLKPIPRPTQKQRFPEIHQPFRTTFNPHFKNSSSRGSQTPPPRERTSGFQSPPVSAATLPKTFATFDAAVEFLNDRGTNEKSIGYEAACRMILPQQNQADRRKA